MYEDFFVLLWAAMTKVSSCCFRQFMPFCVPKQLQTSAVFLSDSEMGQAPLAFRERAPATQHQRLSTLATIALKAMANTA